MSLDLWLRATYSRSTLMYQLGFNNIADFKQKIQEKLTQCPDVKLNINQAGAVLLQELVEKKLTDYLQKNNQLTLGKQQYIQSRINYFKSQEFIDNMDKDIPSRDEWVKTSSEGHTSYIKSIFITDISDKIRSKLEPTKAPVQCAHIIDPPNPADKCYLCNTELGNNSQTNKIECEHILAILPAISHFWLYNTDIPQSIPQDEHQIKEKLKMEYAWSHKCCNRIKNNYDFYKFGIVNQKYIANDIMIMTFYQELLKKINHAQANDSLNCSILKGRSMLSPQLIKDKINTLVEEMNNNLELLGGAPGDISNYYLYMLLCKFKIFSAFSDHDFLNDLLITGEQQYLVEDIILILLEDYIKSLKTKQKDLKKKHNDINIKVQNQNALYRKKNIANRSPSYRIKKIMEERLPQMSGEEMHKSFPLGTHSMARLIFANLSNDNILEEITENLEEVEKLYEELLAAVDDKKESETQGGNVAIISEDLNKRIASFIEKMPIIKEIVQRYPPNIRGVLEQFVQANKTGGRFNKTTKYSTIKTRKVSKASKASKTSKVSKTSKASKYIKLRNIIIKKSNSKTDYKIRNLIGYIIASDKYNPTTKEINKAFNNIFKNYRKKPKHTKKHHKKKHITHNRKRRSN